jgi:hypothetical protein
VNIGSLIDGIAATDDLAIHAGKFRQFMLRVCERVMPAVDDAQYAAILEVARCCVLGRSSLSEIAKARAQVAKVEDELRDFDDARLSAYRLARYLLHVPAEHVSDWFEVLWAFVDEAESAGISDCELVEMLQAEMLK